MMQISLTKSISCFLDAILTYKQNLIWKSTVLRLVNYDIQYDKHGSVCDYSYGSFCKAVLQEHHAIMFSESGTFKKSEKQ
jgi:hypothetical protein